MTIAYYSKIPTCTYFSSISSQGTCEIRSCTNSTGRAWTISNVCEIFWRSDYVTCFLFSTKVSVLRCLQIPIQSRYMWKILTWVTRKSIFLVLHRLFNSGQVFLPFKSFVVVFNCLGFLTHMDTNITWSVCVCVCTVWMDCDVIRDKRLRGRNEKTISI